MTVCRGECLLTIWLTNKNIKRRRTTKAAVAAAEWSEHQSPTISNTRVSASKTPLQRISIPIGHSCVHKYKYEWDVWVRQYIGVHFGGGKTGSVISAQSRLRLVSGVCFCAAFLPMRMCACRIFQFIWLERPTLSRMLTYKMSVDKIYTRWCA